MTEWRWIKSTTMSMTMKTPTNLEKVTTLQVCLINSTWTSNKWPRFKLCIFNLSQTPLKASLTQLVSRVVFLGLKDTSSWKRSLIMIIIPHSRKSESMPAFLVWTSITTKIISTSLKRVSKLLFRANGNLVNLLVEPYIITISRANSYKRSILVMIIIDNCISTPKIPKTREMKKSTLRNKRRSKKWWRKSRSLINFMRNCRSNNNSRWFQLLTQPNKSNRHLPNKIKSCKIWISLNQLLRWYLSVSKTNSKFPVLLLSNSWLLTWKIWKKRSKTRKSNTKGRKLICSGTWSKINEICFWRSKLMPRRTLICWEPG